MKKLVIASFLALLVAAGCSGTPAATTQTVPDGTNAPTSPASPTESAEPEETQPEVTEGEPAPTETDDGTAVFGEGFTWEDGLSVTIGKPKTFKPSDSAFVDGDFKKFVSFEVRIVNKTGKAWDPAMFHATVQSSNQEGEQVFDSPVGEVPSTKLLNNREVKFTIAFGVADPSDIVLEASPDFEHDSVIFTTK